MKMFPPNNNNNNNSTNTINLNLQLINTNWQQWHTLEYCGYWEILTWFIYLFFEHDHKENF